MKMNTNFKGTRPFLILWLGQVVSLVGSGLTRFALGVWVFEQTGSSNRFCVDWIVCDFAAGGAVAGGGCDCRPVESAQADDFE